MGHISSSVRAWGVRFIPTAEWSFPLLIYHTVRGFVDGSVTEVLTRLSSGGTQYSDLQYMDHYTGQNVAIDTDSASEVRRGE